MMKYKIIKLDKFGSHCQLSVANDVFLKQALFAIQHSVLTGVGQGSESGLSLCHGMTLLTSDSVLKPLGLWFLWSVV